MLFFWIVTPCGLSPSSGLKKNNIDIFTTKRTSNLTIIIVFVVFLLAKFSFKKKVDTSGFVSVYCRFDQSGTMFR
jgi:hypothetical protein